MDDKRLMTIPAAYLDEISAETDFELEADRVLGLLDSAEVLEIDCRTGRLGEVLNARGVSWRGIDRDAEMAEVAMKRHGSSVKHGRIFSEEDESLSACFGWFAPFSLISPRHLPDFSAELFRVLSKGGQGVFESWYSPESARPKWALMDVCDGPERKLVRACVPRIDGSKATFDYQWMKGERGGQVQVEQYLETRWLHTDSDIRTQFERHGFVVEKRMVDELFFWVFLKA